MDYRMRQLAAVLLLAATGAAQTSGSAQSAISGLQDPAWAPDGRRIAVSYLDRIWTMSADGKQGKPLTAEGAAIERDPVWSPDGSRIAFAASRGDGFDIVVAPAKGGTVASVTNMPGDERWPSWTPDGRLVFAPRNDPAQGRASEPGL